MNKFGYAILGLVTSGTLASAQLTFSGGTYTQDFNSLPDGPTATNLPWANDSTIPGWFLFAQPASAPAALTQIRASTGTDTTGSFYSFGTAAADRALGAVGSGGTYWNSPAIGSPAGWMAVAFTNTNTVDFINFTLNYTGEQWRVANTSPQSLVFEWGIGATFASVTTWNAPGGSFDFTSPQTSTTASALDGNLAANRVTGLGGTVTTTWAVGDTLWLRWQVLNAPGSDHGLAIDDFSFTATPIPEPSVYALLLGVLVIAFVLRRRIFRSVS